MKNILMFALVLILAVSLVGVAGEKKAEIKVSGMTCNGCVNKVKTTLEKADGVQKAEVSLQNAMAVVTYDDTKTNEESLKKTINSTGFKVADEKKETTADKAECCK